MSRLRSYLIYVFALSFFVLNLSGSFSVFARDLPNGEKTPQSNELSSTKLDDTVIGTALELDGESSYVEIGDSEILNNISEQVTVSLWIKPTAFPKTFTNILFKGNRREQSITHRQFTFWVRNDGMIQFDSSPGGQQARYLMPPSVIKLNEWCHVAGVIDAKRDVMKLFLNGAEVSRDSFKGEDQILKTILPLRIGCSHEEEMGFHASFVGQIDEVRIWNIARTEDNIRSDMTSQLNGDEPGLVGYWKFDKETDGVISDISPHQNDGRLIGNAKLIDYIRPISAISGPGELENAANVYEKLLTRETNFYDAYRYLAEIYLKTNRLSEAEKAYLRALEADLSQSGYNDAISALHKLYTDRGAEIDFVRLLEKLRPKMEGSSILHELLGNAYKEAGEAEKAELAYTQWIDIRKREVDEQNEASEYHNLAEKLLSKGLFPKIALEFAEKAAEIKSVSSYNITLAHAFFKNQMLDEAFQVIGTNLDRRLALHLQSKWFLLIVSIGKDATDKDSYTKKLEDLIDTMSHNLSAHLNFTLALAQFYRENGMHEKADVLVRKTGFVAEDAWTVLGPFDNVQMVGFDTQYIPENLPQIDTAAKYDGKYGKVSWRKYTDDILNGYIHIADNQKWGTAYAFATVNSPDERQVELRFDSDSYGKIWLNGIEVFTHKKSYNVEIDNYTIPVTLNPGKNSILVKLCSEGIDEGGFYLRITDEEGKPFEDLKYGNMEEN